MVRMNANGLVVAAAKFVGLTDSFVFVLPLLRPALRFELIGKCRHHSCDPTYLPTSLCSALL